MHACTCAYVYGGKPDLVWLSICRKGKERKKKERKGKEKRRRGRKLGGKESCGVTRYGMSKDPLISTLSIRYNTIYDRRVCPVKSRTNSQVVNHTVITLAINI
jgi:hypothetical protein